MSSLCASVRVVLVLVLTVPLATVACGSSDSGASGTGATDAGASDGGELPVVSDADSAVSVQEVTAGRVRGCYPGEYTFRYERAARVLSATHCVPAPATDAGGAGDAGDVNDAGDPGDGGASGDVTEQRTLSTAEADAVEATLRGLRYRVVPECACCDGKLVLLSVHGAGGASPGLYASHAICGLGYDRVAPAARDLFAQLASLWGLTGGADRGG